MLRRGEPENQKADAAVSAPETAGGGGPESTVSSRVEMWKREAMYWEHWAEWLPQAVQMAEGEIARRYWRGQWGGVLPEGYDANSVASEVVRGMLVGKCRIALGWTTQRFQKEMERRIGNEVRRLYALSEAAKMRSEWDLLPLGEEDEPQTIFDGVPGTIADPREEAEQNEDEAWWEGVKAGLNEYLKDDSEAQGVFACLCNGLTKRGEIAERLDITVEAVTAARKRLERKVKDYKFIVEPVPY